MKKYKLPMQTKNYKMSFNFDRSCANPAMEADADFMEKSLEFGMKITSRNYKDLYNNLTTVEFKARTNGAEFQPLWEYMIDKYGIDVKAETI